MSIVRRVIYWLSNTRTKSAAATMTTTMCPSNSAKFKTIAIGHSEKFRQTRRFQFSSLISVLNGDDHDSDDACQDCQKKTRQETEEKKIWINEFASRFSYFSVVHFFFRFCFVRSDVREFVHWIANSIPNVLLLNEPERRKWVSTSERRSSADIR